MTGKGNMAQKNKKKKADKTMPFTKKNMQILMIGLILIVLGYIAMAQPPVDSFWSLTAAPVLLLLAYLVIVPYAIMYGHKLFSPPDEGEEKQS
jgi:hypothetical protein